MSGRGGGKGGLKLNGKLCTSIKTRGEDIKSYTAVPGDRMQEGGCNGRRQFNQNPRLSQRAAGWRRAGKRDRTAMFNNVLPLSVVECTIVCKIHGAIKLWNEPKRNDRLGEKEKILTTWSKNIQQKYTVLLSWSCSTLSALCRQKKSLFAHCYFLITTQTLETTRHCLQSVQEIITLHAHM